MSSQQNQLSNRETCYNLIALILGLLLYFGEGVNYSEPGPFFPTDAQKDHGASTTAIGVIAAVFDVANIVGVFLFAGVITKRTQKFFFCYGAFLSLFTNGLFGVIGGWTITYGWTFITLCVVTRIIMGLGCAMLWSSGLALLVPLFPQWSGKIVSTIQCLVGLGSMVGPSLGSAIYAVGGYASPFLASALIEFIILVFCIFVIPSGASNGGQEFTDIEGRVVNLDVDYSSDDDESMLDGPERSHSQLKRSSSDEGYHRGSSSSQSSSSTSDSDLLVPAKSQSNIKEKTFANFVMQPVFVLATLPLIAQASGYATIEVAVSPYLEDYFNVDGTTSGYYFLLFSLGYAVAAPIFGAFVDRGHGGRIFVLSTFIGGAGFVAMFLPLFVKQLEIKEWVLVGLAFCGLATAGSFVTGQLVFETIAYNMGFRDPSKIKVMTAGCSCACVSAGRILGPVLPGGVFLQAYGYYYCCLLQGCALILASILGLIVCSHQGMMGRIYYRKEQSTIDQSEESKSEQKSLTPNMQSHSSIGTSRKESDSSVLECAENSDEESLRNYTVLT